MRSPPTNNENRLKSFCKVGYANFRPNVIAAGKWIIINGDFGRGGAACMIPSSNKKICSFSKNGNV